jgi:hypothetical protein
MWAFVKKRGNIPQIPDSVQSMVQTVTFRQAIWWWRVHLAAPDISFIDVYWLAQKFAFRKQVEDAFDTPYEIDDLQAFLAFRPWEGDEATRHYLDAINRGVIPAVSTLDSAIDEAQSLANMGLDHPSVGAGGENGLLYSQWLAYWVQQNMESIYLDVSNPNLFGALSGVHPTTPQVQIRGTEETK